MFIYNPSRILHGTALHTLIRDAEINSRLGNHALFVTNTDILSDDAVQSVRDTLKHEGVESILFDADGMQAGDEIVNEAVSLASGGRAEYVIGMGTPDTVEYAKIIAAAAGTGCSVYELIDNTPANSTAVRMPFVAVPARCWNPFLFSDKAVIVDPRDGEPKIVRTRKYPDTVFSYSGLLDSLTEKQVLYDVLCILGTCIEYEYHTNDVVGSPLLRDSMSESISILRNIPGSDSGVDRERAQIAGIHAEWVSSGAAVGPFLGRCANAGTGISTEWVTAALLPEVCRYYLHRNPERTSHMMEVLGLDTADDPDEQAGVVENEIRLLAGFADVPLRLRDFGMDASDVSNLAGCVSGMCGVDGDILRELLSAAL